MRLGGIILCGGASTRMGRPKLSLPFGSETMLTRVIRSLRAVARPVIVVAGHEQDVSLDGTPAVVRRDRQPGRGPLEGLAVGLATIAPHSDAAYVTSCDAPLLVPAFVQRMAALLGDCELAVPWDGERLHPLSAVYRPSLLARVEQMLETGQLRLQQLCDAAITRRVLLSELADVDAGLLSMRNVNHPQEYLEALRAAGLPIEPARESG